MSVAPEAMAALLRELRVLREESVVLRARLERCTCGATVDPPRPAPTEEQLEIFERRIACVGCDD